MSENITGKRPIEEVIGTNPGDIPLYIEAEWGDNIIRIRRDLGLQDLLVIARGVHDVCFNEATGEFNPELKDFMLRCNIIEAYTDLKLPDNVEDKQVYANSIGLINLILYHVNKDQYEALVKAIDEKINYTANANIYSIQKEFEEAMKTMDEFTKNAEKVFSGLDEQTINNLSKMISETGISNMETIGSILGTE